MSSNKFLKRWHAAGLLSDEQAKRIEEYEQEHASASWVLYGLTGLGVLVVLVGVISIVAANWMALPDGVKLVLYFASLLALAAATLGRLSKPGVVREALLCAFGLYILAGIGLIGQIYHLVSDGYSGLFLWLALLLPMQFLTESRLLNNLWFSGLLTAVSLWNVESFRDETAVRNIFTTLSLPYFTIALGYCFGSRAVAFSLAARIWGFAVLLLPFAIGGNIAWSVGHRGILQESWQVGFWPLLPLCGVLCAGVTAHARDFKKSTLITYAIYTVLTTSFVISAIPLIFPLHDGHPLIGCILFIIAWGGAAAVAAGMDRKRLFDCAALVIGIRFIVVYFQVFGSLAATGIGLILSGAVILGIAYVWFRFRGKVAKALKEAV
jgi:uncharacterized membrane protein